MKYYKILSNDLNMRGYQYKEGLNIDTETIIDIKYCYGLYFSDTKNIFGFAGYGDKIADVTIPNDAKVYHYEDKSKADKVILSNIRNLWDINTIKELIKDGVNIHADRDYILRVACEKGNLDIVKYLVEQGANIHAANEYALRVSCAEGNLDMVKYLVEQGADIYGVNEGALRSSCIRENLDIVKYLKSMINKEDK